MYGRIAKEASDQVFAHRSLFSKHVTFPQSNADHSIKKNKAGIASAVD